MSPSGSSPLAVPCDLYPAPSLRPFSSPAPSSPPGAPKLHRLCPHVPCPLYHSRPLRPPLRQVRPGCIDYGQWRRYAVEATGVEAANLYTKLSTRVSRLSIRDGLPPTLLATDVQTSTADGWSEGEGGGGTRRLGLEGGGETMSVSVSPGDPFAARTWHVAVYLAAEAEAEAAGLSPTTYELHSSLTASRKRVGERVLPRSQGGEGSVCCGQMVNYAVHMNDSAHALHIVLNVTYGAVRAVYLKYDSCMVYPDDIDGQICRGLCVMTWYVSFDRYTGLRRYSVANTTTVSTGGSLPDMRMQGEWFVTVQDAGVTGHTEFAMYVDEIIPPAGAADIVCDRFGRFDCNNDMWIVPPDLISLASSAPASPCVGSSALVVLGLWWLWNVQQLILGSTRRHRSRHI